MKLTRTIRTLEGELLHRLVCDDCGGVAFALSETAACAKCAAEAVRKAVSDVHSAADEHIRLYQVYRDTCEGEEEDDDIDAADEACTEQWWTLQSARETLREKLKALA